MTRFDSPVGRVVLRTLYYAAVLVAAWVVANMTGAAAPVFIYQGF